MNFDLFKYCPQCGLENSLQFNDRKISCNNCPLEFYINIAAAVAAIIYHEEKILLATRAREPQKGKLDLPGGFVDLNEPAEDALKREIHEELNIEISDLRFFATAPNRYLYKGFEYPVLDLFFTCRPVDLSNCRPQDDVADFDFYAPHEINPDDLAFDSTRMILHTLTQNK